jgi:DNA topoisomerase-3
MMRAIMKGNGYVVTYTFGHLCTLRTNDYKSCWKELGLNNLPMLRQFETKVVENSGIKQFKIIKSLFDKAS